jgi:hypothetical protein
MADADRRYYTDSAGHSSSLNSGLCFALRNPCRAHQGLAANQLVLRKEGQKAPLNQTLGGEALPKFIVKAVLTAVETGAFAAACTIAQQDSILSYAVALTICMATGLFMYCEGLFGWGRLS